MGNDSVKSKKYFWVLLNLVLAAVFLNIVFFVMPMLKSLSDSFFPVRTLTVSAEGKALVAPDVAEASFGTVTRGQDVGQIVDDNNRKINSAIEFVKSLGIETKDIKTAGYHLSPDYRYDPDTGESSITGYTITQTVVVKIREFTLIGDLVGGLPSRGINQIGGINFRVDEPEKFLGAAREEAIQKARAKAEAITRANGVRLGKLVSIGEFGGPPPVPYFARQEAAFGGKGGDIVPPTIEPGQEEIMVNVSLTFALR
jgi:uncharacterized protein YggE